MSRLAPTVPLIALLVAAALLPSSASGGGDVSHFVEIGCVPGEPMRWKRETPWMNDRAVVVGCPDGIARGKLQIATGPEGRAWRCHYFSHSGGDGTDTCSAGRQPLLTPKAEPFVEPLLVVRSARSRPSLLLGVTDSLAERVAVRPPRGPGSVAELLPVIWEQTPDLVRPYQYFAARVRGGDLCPSSRLEVRAQIAGSVTSARVRRPLSALDATDPLPHSVPIGKLCRRIAKARAEPAPAAALIERVIELVAGLLNLPRRVD